MAGNASPYLASVHPARERRVDTGHRRFEGDGGARRRRRRPVSVIAVAVVIAAGLTFAAGDARAGSDDLVSGPAALLSLVIMVKKMEEGALQRGPRAERQAARQTRPTPQSATGQSREATVAQLSAVSAGQSNSAD